MASKEYMKAYYQANKDKFIKKTDDRKSQMKTWREANKGKVNSNRKTKKESNPLFALRVRIATLVSNKLKAGVYTQNSKVYDILGCSYDEFKLHLESKFESWMSWDNRGLYNGTPNYGWDIDHIISLSSASTEDELIKLNHYTNVQPLCSYVNRNVKKT